jgi:hypothetical protein
MERAAATRYGNTGSGFNDVIQREHRANRTTSSFATCCGRLGIEKGKPFKPDARQTKILTTLCWSVRRWPKPTPRTVASRAVRFDPTHIGTLRLQLDADNPRPSGDCSTSARHGSTRPSARAAMAPKRPWPSSAYLALTKTKRVGSMAATRIVLRVPLTRRSNCSVRHALRHRHARADRQRPKDCRSLVAHGLAQNDATASVDIYTGPTVPAGFEKNWDSQPCRARTWFAYFRLSYQPTEPYFDRVVCVATPGLSWLVLRGESIPKSRVLISLGNPLRSLLSLLFVN